MKISTFFTQKFFGGNVEFFSNKLSKNTNRYYLTDNFPSEILRESRLDAHPVYTSELPGQCGNSVLRCVHGYAYYTYPLHTVGYAHSSDDILAVIMKHRVHLLRGLRLLHDHTDNCDTSFHIPLRYPILSFLTSVPSENVIALYTNITES